MKIVKNKTKLKIPVAEVTLSKKETDFITEVLTIELESKGGIGLAINQLEDNSGLPVTGRACILNVIEPLVLINPKIVKRSPDNIVYAEQCLSNDKSMKKPIKTVRSKRVTVDCDNLGTVEFGPTQMIWNTKDEFFNDQGMLECACVQHEIDHLDGILMTDSSRKYTTTVTVGYKYGRNERVMVKLPDGSTEFMKYKKAVPMLDTGCEIL